MKTIDCAGSSNVDKLEYFKDESILQATFKGGSVYNYLNVPGRKIKALEESLSKGKFLRTDIMPYFPAHKVN